MAADGVPGGGKIKNRKLSQAMQTDDEEEEVERSEDDDRQREAEQSRGEQSAGPAGRHRRGPENQIHEEEKVQES